MHAIWNGPGVQILASLLMAFVLGGIVGCERQYRQRTAGLRTNVLVAVGAALFVHRADRLDGHGGSVRVISYVISGIGFLGAGVIMREEGNVRGINTAATLWGSAAIGAACGARLFFEASLGALFVLAANTLLRPLVNAMNRQPLDTEAVEATYTDYAMAAGQDRQNALEQVEQTLESAGYPIREMQQHAFGQGEVEIEATLMTTSVDGDALDAVVEDLAKRPQIHQAFWSLSTSESSVSPFADRRLHTCDECADGGAIRREKTATKPATMFGAQRIPCALPRSDANEPEFFGRAGRVHRPRCWLLPTASG